MASDIEQEYNSRIPLWKSLLEEVLYSLQESVSAGALKIHLIEGRVKALESVVGKSAAKNYDDPINEMDDIVGVRVVTLFKSNLSDIDDIIGEEFIILSKDDKTNDDDSVMGYRSIHYVCAIKSEYIGPRYKKIAGQKFEIQVRTLCMHAWSAVSHYIDYKGDWDVPKDLKTSLRALSGLFHIADSQFEQFFVARENYQEKLAGGKATKKTQELNLETLAKYLDTKFKNRRFSNKGDVSSLLHELKEMEILTVGALDKALDEAKSMLDEVECKRNNKFATVGAVRVSIALVSQKYRDSKYSGIGLDNAKALFATE